jgi:hypothetical protein
MAAKARMQATPVPGWYVQAVQMIGHTDGILRNLELELLDFMDRQSLDWRVQRELLGLVEALHGTAGALALVEMAMRSAVRQVRSAGLASPPAVSPQWTCRIGSESRL